MTNPGSTVPRQNLDVKNLDTQTYWVKVSKTLGQGQDQYFAIEPGATERGKRHVAYKVTMTISTDGGGATGSIEHTMGPSAHDNDYNINVCRKSLRGSLKNLSL